MAHPALSIAELLDGVHDGIVRAHAALRVRRTSGWVDVDATFDPSLTEAGFIVTERWDGRSAMPLVVTPLSRVESTLPPEHEERLLGISHRTSLPGSVVRELTAWLEMLRSR